MIAPRPVSAQEQARRSTDGLSLWALAWRRLLRRPSAIASIVYIVLLILVAILADQLSPYEFAFQDLAHARVNPLTPGHWLGTDGLGRDILTRLLHGARVSMSVAGVVTLVALTIGLTLGAAAGYYGGKIDMVIMRFADIMFAFPDLLLAILIMGIRGAGISNIYMALGVVAWPGLARIVRGQVLALREQDYVLAARSLGNNDFNIIIRHLMPNVLSPVLVHITLSLASFILAEATLSFLGIGVRPPQPSWGSIINEMLTMVYSQPQLLIAPGLVLALTVLAFNFLGDGLRDALDPRIRHQ